MKRSALILLLLMATNLFAQNNDLKRNIDAINSQLREIKTVKGIIGQRLSVRSGSIVSFDITNTDKKGNRSSESYVIDLADIDPSPYGLRSGIQRNRMKVQVFTANAQRLIAKMNQGEISSYLTSFKLDAEDSDHATALKNALKNAALTAKALEDATYSYGSFDEIRMDLSSAVKPFSTVTVQKITFDSQRKDKLNLHVQKNNGVTKRYEFNLKDMNATSLKVEAHGKTLSIPVDVYGGEKLVKLYENDLAKGFVTRFVIYAESVKQVKRIKRLFELAIEAANGKLPETSTGALRQQTSNSSPSSSSGTNATSTQNSGKVALSKDPASGMYSYAGVYDMSGYSAARIRQATQAFIPSNMRMADSPKQLVFQSTRGSAAVRLAGYAYIYFTVKVGFKDNKIRVMVTDFSYENRITKYSRPERLEHMEGKKLNKVMGDINDRVSQEIRGFLGGVRKQLRLTSNEDW